MVALSSSERAIPHCFNIYLNFFFFGSCDKKALPCYFAAALEHHKKTTTTTKKTRGKKTFEHRQCRTLPCLSRVWERYLLFASVSVSEHIYIFPYKVNSHISSLLKVFTLLRYLLCEHFRRIFFEPPRPSSIVVDLFIPLVLCYCAYILCTAFFHLACLFRAQEAHRLFLRFWTT